MWHKHPKATRKKDSMARYKDPSYGKFRPARIWVSEDGGLTIHSQYYNYGYGSTYVTYVSDDPVAILEARDKLKQEYAPGWYCGTWREPIEFAPGLFVCWCDHSESCE